jgi:hypothetical protein
MTEFNVTRFSPHHHSMHISTMVTQVTDTNVITDETFKNVDY